MSYVYHACHAQKLEAGISDIALIMIEAGVCMVTCHQVSCILHVAGGSRTSVHVPGYHSNTALR